jgi:hypothetical protein
VLAILNNWQLLPEAEAEEDDADTFGAEAEALVSGPQFWTLTQEEKQKLQAFIYALNANQERDPKCRRVLDLLLREKWLGQGCSIFSQWFDSIERLAQHLSKEDLPAEKIGIYAGAQRSGVMGGESFALKTGRR